MELTEKKQLSAALKQALTEEHLWTKDAGLFLNINPAYISMMLNPKLFDKAAISAWHRIKEWSTTKGKISDFKLPDGEKVRIPVESVKRKPKEKPAAKTSEKLQTNPPAGNIPGSIESTLTELTECARVKVCLDIEINLHVNGTKVLIA